jgi:cytochrome c-type biogenesis protein
MVDLPLFYFSFLQGVLAFFAPCAVALLPGYITRFVTKGEHEKTVTRSLKLAGLMILGFITIYAIAGALLALISQVVKQYLPYIVMVLGVFIIIMGFLMFLGKNIALPIHLRFKESQNELVEGYLFGIIYGLAALGCLFPLFLIVATSALAAPTILEGGSYFFAYILGMALFMVIFSLLAVFSQKFLAVKMKRFMPYITRVSGFLLMLGGIYIIYYQSALL